MASNLSNPLNNMKNKIILTVSLALLFGCNPSPENKVEPTKNGDFTIKVIDSCEYIEYDNGIFDQRVYSLTHKGNCKFCEKRNLWNKN